MKTTTQKPKPRFASYVEIPKTYRELCQLYLPRPIHDDQENREATEMMNDLAVFEKLNSEQKDYLDVLIEFVDAVKGRKRPSKPKINALFDSITQQQSAIRRNLIAKLEQKECLAGPGRTESDKWDKELVNLELAFLGDTATQLDVGNSLNITSTLDAEATADQVRIAVLKYLLKLVTHNLVRLAKSGNADAIFLLAATGIDLVRNLNKLARFMNHAKALRPFAHLCEVWPVLKSKNSNLSDNEQDFFGSLQIGKGLKRNFSRPARWALDSFASKLWEEIDDVRERYRNRGAALQLIHMGLSDSEKEFVDQSLNLQPFDQPQASKMWADLAKKRCVQRMKESKEYRRFVEKTAPNKKKQSPALEGWLTTDLRRKFANMSGRK